MSVAEFHRSQGHKLVPAFMTDKTLHALQAECNDPIHATFFTVNVLDERVWNPSNALSIINEKRVVWFYAKMENNRIVKIFEANVHPEIYKNVRTHQIVPLLVHLQETPDSTLVNPLACAIELKTTLENGIISSVVPTSDKDMVIYYQVAKQILDMEKVHSEKLAQRDSYLSQQASVANLPRGDVPVARPARVEPIAVSQRPVVSTTVASATPSFLTTLFRNLFVK